MVTKINLERILSFTRKGLDYGWDIGKKGLGYSWDIGKKGLGYSWEATKNTWNSFSESTKKKIIMGAIAAGVLTGSYFWFIRSDSDSIKEETKIPEYAEKIEFNKKDLSEIEFPQLISLYNKQYYVEKLKNPKKGQLEIALIPKDSSKIRIKHKKAIPYSNGKFIFERDEDPRGTVDPYVDGIVLSRDKYDPLTGVPGVKARIKIEKNNGKEFPVISYKYGELSTLTLVEEEYYFPHVPAKEIEKRKTDFYLIPEKDSELEIDPKTGQVTIYNENKVYRGNWNLNNISSSKKGYD